VFEHQKETKEMAGRNRDIKEKLNASSKEIKNPLKFGISALANIR
jgi:hypothetical protein